ncbi:MAG: glycosyltransferase [Anaerolineae bacterium]
MQSQPPGTVYVGIVTYNSRNDLPGLLDSLAAQTYPQLTVALLDNASTDGTPPWIREYAPQYHRILQINNVGFGRGHNRIYQFWREAMTSYDFYMTLNPDVQLTPTYIEAVVDEIQSMGAGWGMGKLLQPNGEKIYSVGHALKSDGYAFNIGYDLPDDSRFSTPREVFGASGAAAIYRQTMLEALTPDGNIFDPVMFMYNEDVDLDWRAQLGGWKCRYTPDAVAIHRGSQPSAWLRAEALANRYLSVMKNTSERDYVLRHLPRIYAHVAARLLLTPREGAYLLGKLSQYGAKERERRTVPRVPRSRMREWYRWADRQPTGQPTSLMDRVRVFSRG